MRSILCSAFLAAGLFASAAHAQTTSQPQTQAASAKAAPAAGKTADGDKVVCRSMIETGSHFQNKECHTQAQWDQISADSRQMTLDSQRNYGPH